MKRLGAQTSWALFVFIPSFPLLECVVRKEAPPFQRYQQVKELVLLHPWLQQWVESENLPRCQCIFVADSVSKQVHGHLDRVTIGHDVVPSHFSCLWPCRRLVQGTLWQPMALATVLGVLDCTPFFYFFYFFRDLDSGNGPRTQGSLSRFFRNNASALAWCEPGLCSMTKLYWRSSSSHLASWSSGRLNL